MSTLDEAIAKLKTLLAHISIGEPVKSFLKPRLSIASDIGESIILFNISINTKDSSKPSDEIQVHFQELLHAERIVHMVENPDYFFAFVRESLHRVMTHELDECLRVDDELRFDPHERGRG